MKVVYVSGPRDLSPWEEETALRLARRTLEVYLTSYQRPKIEAMGFDIPQDSKLKTERGVFVTLKRMGQLRGCIGNILPQNSLDQAIVDRAISAAVEDPRFNPVVLEELPHLNIELSVLTPLRKVNSYKEIEIGKHGILLNRRGRRAVFLPQVAPEQGWSLTETLMHLSMKAGLSIDAWKEHTEFQVFEAQVFREG